MNKLERVKAQLTKAMERQEQERVLDIRYAGVRNADGTCTVLQWDTGADLDPRTDLRNHSPTGFEWGYGGSGPAQLALAILCDALQDDELALVLYQDFKFAWVAGVPKERNWTLTGTALGRIVAGLKQRYAEPYIVYCGFGAIAIAEKKSSPRLACEVLWEGEAVSERHAEALARKACPRIDADGMVAPSPEGAAWGRAREDT